MTARAAEILAAAHLAQSWAPQVAEGSMTLGQVREFVPQYLLRQRFYGPRRAERVLSMTLQFIAERNYREARNVA